MSARHWQPGVHRGWSRSPWRRGEPINKRRQLIPGTVQDPEEILHEANCGARVTAYEHYKENYQRPAEGPAHDSLPAALRLSITHPPRYSDFMRGMRWSA